MVSAQLSYNPYLLCTTVEFNGQKPRINSQIEKYIKVPLKDWVQKVPDIYYNEMNGYDFELYFVGTKSDFEEVKKVFQDKGISNEVVRLVHKNELEDADTKNKEIKDLLEWLKDNPNRKFDFQDFWKLYENEFESAYPYVMIRGNKPFDSNELFSPERVESAEELRNTDLKSTPIIISIDEENKGGFRKDLNDLLKRTDIRVEQLFFMIDASLNRNQIVRIISDLGVKNPQVVERYDEENIMKFIKNYPLTEHIRRTIIIFRSEVEHIAEILEKENKESEVTNAGVYKELEALEQDILLLKEADYFFVQRDNYEFPGKIKEICETVNDKIRKWKNRKTKITGESEIEMAANDYVTNIQRYVDEYREDLKGAFLEAITEIDNEFSTIYKHTEIDIDYKPENIEREYDEEIILPEMKSKFTELISYEEGKNDFFGLLKKVPDEKSESDKIVTCYLEQWRVEAQEMVLPVLQEYVERLIEQLEDYYNELAEIYHHHLTKMIEKKTKDKEKVAARLSDDERKLQEDNEWLAKLKGMLEMIERG